MSYDNMSPDRPLAKLAADLPAILEAAAYAEMYGVELHAGTADSPTPHPTLVILQKFLRANSNDVAAAKTQLTEALKWRKEYRPLDALNETFPSAKFAGLGYVTTVHGAKETHKESDTATFNIYGAAVAKDPKVVFGDTDAFVRWRVALMELTLKQLKLGEADQVVPDYGSGPDPYQAIQVHDYQSVSFFRQPAEIKASSSKIIEMFQKYYPETVSYKYFVNVPIIMSWMMALMKGLMSKDSIQKMTWMTSGSELRNYLGDDIPQEYGGKGQPLSDVGLTVSYDETAEEEEQPAAVEPQPQVDAAPPQADNVQPALVNDEAPEAQGVEPTEGDIVR